MRCTHCKSDVTPVPPRSAWKIASLVLWVSALVTAVGFSLPIGLNVVLLPAWLCIGMAVGVAARRVSSWTCPVCKAELGELPFVEPAPPVPARRGVPVPA